MIGGREGGRTLGHMLDTAAASCRTKLPSQGHLMAAPINPQNPTPLNDQNDTPGGGNRRGGDYRRWADRTLCRPLLGSLTSRGFTGSGFQPAMIRAQSRACALSLTPGNKRRSSTAADSSPPRSKAARIAAASASVTTNMSTGWVRAPRAASAIMSLKWAGSGPRGHLGGGYGRRWASGGGWADIPGTGWSVMVASCPDLVAWSRSMDASQPLAVARWRGRVAREPDWARTPGQPMVLVSTVDQVGSPVVPRLSRIRLQPPLAPRVTARSGSLWESISSP